MLEDLHQTGIWKLTILILKHSVALNWQQTEATVDFFLNRLLNRFSEVFTWNQTCLDWLYVLFFWEISRTKWWEITKSPWTVQVISLGSEKMLLGAKVTRHGKPILKGDLWEASVFTILRNTENVKKKPQLYINMNLKFISFHIKKILLLYQGQHRDGSWEEPAHIGFRSRGAGSCCPLPAYTAFFYWLPLPLPFALPVSHWFPSSSWNQPTQLCFRTSVCASLFNSLLNVRNVFHRTSN